MLLCIFKIVASIYCCLCSVSNKHTIYLWKEIIMRIIMIILLEITYGIHFIVGTKVLQLAIDQVKVVVLIKQTYTVC